MTKSAPHQPLSRWLSICVIAIGTAVPALPAAVQTTLESMLGAAVHQQEIQGDLKAAIAGYQKVLAATGVSRKIAAEALVRMGQCYERLGNVESRKAYERVVREYADQTEAATLARTRLGASSTAHTGLPSFRQLWKAPTRVSLDGFVARNGRYLPYIDWDEHGDIFLHDFVTGADRRLTNAGTDGVKNVPYQAADSYVLSPDGQQMAISWYRGDKINRTDLRLIDLKGQGIPQPRTVLDVPDIEGITPTDWSADGKLIAARINRVDKSAQIGLISVSDGTLRILKSIDWRGAKHIFFSPDGKYLAYCLPENETTQQSDIFVLATDGSREIPAVVHRGDDVVMGWSSDGTRLLFASDRNGAMDLWSIGFGNGAVQSRPELIKTDIGQAKTLGLTGTGALVMQVARGTQQPTRLQMTSFDPATGKLTGTPTDLSAETFESDRLISSSHDGKYFSYIAQRGRGSSQNEVLVIRSSDTGSTIREIKLKLTNVYLSHWAPDGHSHYMQGRDLKGRWGIFHVDWSGEVAPLDLNVDIRNPQLTADGKSMYFVRPVNSGKERAVFHRDLTSGKETELYRNAAVFPDSPSPDGKHFAFSTIEQSTGSRIKLLFPISGGEPRVLMRVPARVSADDLPNYSKGDFLAAAQWSPDGKWFLTFKNFNGVNPTKEPWIVPIDGGNPIKLDLKLENGALSLLLRDGKTLVCVFPEERSNRTEEVWSLENFLPVTTTARK